MNACPLAPVGALALLALAPLAPHRQQEPVAAGAAPAPSTAVVLPTCRLGLPVEDAGSIAALTIRSDGRVLAGAETLYDPGGEGGPAALGAWLQDLAKRMPKAHQDREREAGPLLPDAPLLLFVDESAPFGSVQRVLQGCGAHDVAIWKTELAVRTEDGELRRLPAHLPVDLGHHGEPLETAEVVLRVLQPGSRLTPDGEPWTGAGRHVFGKDRELRYTLGPVRSQSLEQIAERVRQVQRKHDLPLVVDARAGVTCGEVVALLDLVLENPSVPVLFVGTAD